MKLISRLSSLIKKGQLAIFCGAGISYHSGFPLADELVERILYELNLSPEEIQTILGAKLPFESIAGILAEETGSLKFLDIYKKGKPNANHRLITTLAGSGYLKLVITTNFDTLIEQAFIDGGLSPSAYEVFSDEAEFTKINWHTYKVILVKIHGSIENKRKMAVTLKMIAQAQLTQGRNEVIGHLFKNNRPVLFLGYSFSDVFDLSPQIRLLGTCASEVFVLAHRTGKVLPTKANVSKRQRLPFTDFPNATEIKMDTDELVRKLSIACTGLTLTEDKSKPPDWRSSLEKAFTVARQKDPTVTEGIAGRLFYLAAKFPAAADKYAAALKLADTDERRCNHLRNLGIVHKELGNYLQALDYLHEAEKLAGGLRDKKMEASILNNASYTYGSLKDYPKALEYEKRSIAMARQIRSRELIAINYNNLGILQGAQKQYKEAKSSFIKALALMDSLGLIQWKPRTLNNMGIAVRLLGHPDKCLKFHLDALKLAGQLGFKDEELLSHENMARAFRSLDRFPYAIKEVRKAIILAKKSGKRDSLRKCLTFLSSIYGDMGEKSKERYYRRAAASIDH